MGLRSAHVDRVCGEFVGGVIGRDCGGELVEFWLLLWSDHLRGQGRARLPSLGLAAAL